MAHLYAGTSGFAYASWKPDFYPATLPARRFLEHYATRLPAVEVNYTFRRMPAAATLEAWAEATPPGFVFAVKANMRITHILRLQNARLATRAFLKALAPLRPARLGPILFQLPPNLKRDDKLLAAYLKTLPKDLRYAFEFRHPSWLAEEVYAELRRHNVSLCIAESEKLEVPEVITADFIYYRLRKPSYSKAAVKAMAPRCKKLLATSRNLYVMFQHGETAAGALNAERLMMWVG
ncbi:MAG: DUF72 domain-containing protein [Bryobacteraceae bacterium]